MRTLTFQASRFLRRSSTYGEEFFEAGKVLQEVELPGC